MQLACPEKQTKGTSALALLQQRCPSRYAEPAGWLLFSRCPIRIWAEDATVVTFMVVLFSLPRPVMRHFSSRVHSLTAPPFQLLQALNEFD
jgi:hypothetical protein